MNFGTNHGQFSGHAFFLAVPFENNFEILGPHSFPENIGEFSPMAQVPIDFRVPQAVQSDGEREFLLPPGRGGVPLDPVRFPAPEQSRPVFVMESNPEIPW